MNRRAFLSGLATLAAAATLDPERLLWTPGRRTIFIPPPIQSPRLIVSVNGRALDANEFTFNGKVIVINGYAPARATITVGFTHARDFHLIRDLSVEHKSDPLDCLVFAHG